MVVVYTHPELVALTMPQLKEILRAFEQPETDNKADLINRILELDLPDDHLKLQPARAT